MDTNPSAAPAAPVTAAEPAAAATPSEATPGLPSQASIIARSIEAGHAAVKAAAESVATEPAPAAVEDVPAPPTPADVAPAPSEIAEPPAEAPLDPIAALEARFIAAMEKQNAALMEHLAKLTATPQAPAAEPEKQKPDTKPADRKLADSPYEVQARDYFGDLPKPLMTQATEVLEKRHGWQMELRAAEAAAQGGDAAAAARVAAAQASLAQVARVIERIEFDAQLATPAPAAPMAWGVTARDTLVDITLSEREQWPPLFQSLEDHEVASVLRGVTAGATQEDYFARAEKALTAYATKRQGTAPAATAQPAAAPAPTPTPKNPAPPAPPKVETTVTGDPWDNNALPSRHEKVQRIIARGRGDALAN